MPAGRAALFGMLVLAGAAWGAGMPLAKIAVTAGYRHFGIIFWQMVIGAAVLGAILAWQGRRVPVTRATFPRFVVIALIGTVVPNAAGYEAVRHLPSGLLAVILSVVPLIAFPVALALGTDRFTKMRLGGLALGLCGVLLIILPDASLPNPAAMVWLPLALVAPFCYAVEGNVVAKWGLGGMDPLQLMFGASVFGACLVLPLALATGQFIDPRPPYILADFAIVGAALLNIFAYTTYVWLVGRAGPSFAVQVAYLVTGFGVFWAMLILGERFSLWVWAAMVVLMAGIALVQPRAAITEKREGDLVRD